ncbi:PH domain-containing protein [Gleimia sp. 6138-11-ORH1]|uniref:PH domain-containing protein n=1 Tax=Gleimia sp. 6138-11-ORH1 TaxID=2973937 RepID=UPI002169ED3C|nr:PH domain-containing protein [Gleimia sp. 6138-11-ORH1]MCS4484465.1 PH domain-containing protein [Gleimia sp. 6138-11-ORH1]
MSEVETTIWMFMNETSVPTSARDFLLPNEEPFAAYETFRHQALITSKRIIVRDSRDVSGESVEVLSLPFSTILMWSTRSAGTRGFTSQLNLVTLAGDVTIRLGREINVGRLDRLIAEGVLSSR